MKNDLWARQCLLRRGRRQQQQPVLLQLPCISTEQRRPLGPHCFSTQVWQLSPCGPLLNKLVMDSAYLEAAVDRVSLLPKELWLSPLMAGRIAQEKSWYKLLLSCCGRVLHSSQCSCSKAAPDTGAPFQMGDTSTRFTSDCMPAKLDQLTQTYSRPQQEGM